MTSFEITKRGRARITEEATFAMGIAEDLAPLLSASLLSGDIPACIYPEIRAISANSLTRNKTYYSKESLTGDPRDGSGYRSALTPYPIPIIRDHKSSPDETGFASPVYGRACASRFVQDPGGGYVSLICKITDPEAVAGILSGRFLTTSIGVESQELRCGICGADLINLGPGGCGHYKGELYNYQGREVEGYWKIGPIYFRETSFVVVPSDVRSGVINPDIGIEKVRLLTGQKEQGLSLPGKSFRETLLSAPEKKIFVFSEAPGSEASGPYAKINFIPPAGVRSAASRGLDLYKAGKGGDGLTEGAITRAHSLAEGKPISPEIARKMHGWFARHSVDRKPDWGKKGQETPGFTAWALWGNDAGQSWANKLCSQMDAADKKKEMSMPRLTLGELYALPPEDAQYLEESEFASESYPEADPGQFAASEKRFPLVNLKSALEGLSLLERSQVDNKSEVRARLIKAVADSSQKVVTPLVVLRDEALAVSIPYVTSESNFEETLTDPALEAIYPEVASVIAAYCLKENLTLPGALSEVTAAKEVTPVILPLTEKNYPLLYPLTNASVSSELLVARRAQEQREDFERAYVAQGQLLQAETAKVITYEEKALELTSQAESLQSEMTKASDLSGQKIAELEEKVKALPQTSTEASQLEALKDQTQILSEQLVVMTQEKHKALASQVALLKKLARRIPARNKSLAVLTSEHLLRSPQSLTDDLADLLEEVNVGDPGFDESTVPKVASPVLPEESEEKSHVVLDEHNKPTITGKITETTEGTYGLLNMGGPNKEKVSAAVKKLLNQ